MWITLKFTAIILITIFFDFRTSDGIGARMSRGDIILRSGNTIKAT